MPSTVQELHTHDLPAAPAAGPIPVTAAERTLSVVTAWTLLQGSLSPDASLSTSCVALVVLSQNKY